uniref:Uncharacterized protein n=1 Tax=Euplotes harpa TaxID=151035 RepID=A0A7S3JEI1_9SPIT|mmetsp:Transcript_32633/g.37222  ORF Transcript_32633/g.37222 Transcript_32633/m.37222 type:complete len:100 (+) Transcript_32633:684-983(+)
MCEQARAKREHAQEAEELQEIISEMAQTINKLKRDFEAKSKTLFDSILEKDVRIQEIEEHNENLDSRISLFNKLGIDIKSVDEINEITTTNNALKSNLK